MTQTILDQKKHTEQTALEQLADSANFGKVPELFALDDCEAACAYFNTEGLGKYFYRLVELPRDVALTSSPVEVVVLPDNAPARLYRIEPEQLKQAQTSGPIMLRNQTPVMQGRAVAEYLTAEADKFKDAIFLPEIGVV